MAVPRLLQPVRGVGGQRRVELLMQRKLLAQGLAQFVVIVDDEDLARIAHGRPLGLISLPRVVSGPWSLDKHVAWPD